MSGTCAGKVFAHEEIKNHAYYSSARADLVHTQWEFCPSIPAAILFLVLFALTTTAHLSQAIYYKKPYCWVIVGSGLLQTVNYLIRVIKIMILPNSEGPYAAWFVLILVCRYRFAQATQC